MGVRGAYYAQLISLAKYNKPLFEDRIYAFNKRPVVEKFEKYIEIIFKVF